MKKTIPALFIIFLFCGTSCFADSVSIKASETSVIAAQQTVAFTCTATLSASEHSKTITFEIDYQDDGTADETKTITFSGNTPNYTFHHRFAKAGFWDTIVTALVNGETLTSDKVTISVAQWRFPSLSGSGTIGGIESTPAVGADGTIYVGSDDGRLYAINPDGTKKWSFKTGDGIVSSPAIDSDGYIYFGSEDGHLYCLTPEGPETRWAAFDAGAPIVSSPALSRDEKTVYIASTGGSLYAVDTQTGKPTWSQAFKTGANIVSSPVVGFDGTIYIGALNDYLYAVNPDGSLRWEKDLKSGIYGGIALDADGTIYAGTGQLLGATDTANQFYAISQTGNKMWHVAVSGGFDSTPVITASGTICAGSYDNLLYAFSRDGDTSWTFKPFSNDIMSAAAVGSNGLIYTASKDGMIYAIEPDQGSYTDGREIAWQYDMNMPDTTSSPVVANGSVYIGTCSRDEGALWAFDTESATTAASQSSATEADSDSPWPLMRNDIENSGRTGYTSDTISAALVQTDPANGATDFDISRNSITATFSKAIDHSLVYVAPTDSSDGYYGFTVSPFDNYDSSEFKIKWLSAVKVELVLPDGASFQKGTTYTATIETSTTTNGLLSSHTWTFSYTPSTAAHYSNGRGCFISCLGVGRN